MLGCFAIRQSRVRIPPPRQQVSDFGSRRYRFLEDLQALAVNLASRIDADAGQVRSGMREIRDQSPRGRVTHESYDRYRGRLRRKRFDEIVEIANDDVRIAAHHRINGCSKAVGMARG